MGSWNAVALCLLGMLLLFPYGNAAFICVLEMVYVYFAYWECCCYFLVINVVVIHVSVIPLLFVFLVFYCHLCIGSNIICLSGIIFFAYRNDWILGQSSRIRSTFFDRIIYKTNLKYRNIFTCSVIWENKLYCNHRSYYYDLCFLSIN